MTEATLEHVNVTVADAKATAARLCAMFDWKIRWEGDSIHEGYSVHVGGEKSYIALYSPKTKPDKATESYFALNGLNHVGITVDDLDGAEDRVRAAGYKPYSHADYEPGRRFYFHDDDGIEYEVVQYD